MKKGWMLALIALSMISCQKGEQASKELPPSRFSVNPNEPSYKLQDEQGVITWYVNFDWYIPPTGSGVVSQKILTDTNTRLRVIRGNDDTLNQMIASGEMPDIVTVGTWTSFPKIAHRWAMPLNQLADAYDPYFYQVAKRDTLAWYTDDQGNIYGYPASSNDYEDFLGEDSVLNGGPTFLVRQDIYRAIGSPDMRTPEGFLQALRDAKTYDPTIMPLVFGIESTFSESIIEMLASFLAIPTLQDGKHYERIFDAEYLRWIEVLRQAHQEGLILDDNFTYNKIEYNDGFNGGQYFAVFASTLNAIKYQLINNHNRNPNQHYLAIDGPANRNLDAPHLTASGIGGWALTFITQGSQNKERAIQLLTYLMSEEGHFTSQLGIEGETYYRGEDGLYRYTPVILDLQNNDNEAFLTQTEFPLFWMLLDSNFLERNTDISVAELNQIWHWSLGKFVPQFALEESDPDARTAEERSWIHYQEERIEAVIRMIRSSSPEQLQAEVERLQTFYQSEAIQRAIAVKNEKIAQNIKKLAKMGYA